MSKGTKVSVAEDFYPFVENGTQSQHDAQGQPLLPQHPARIAVYDDASAAPRVVVVEPKDVRSYLEEITLQVTQLAQQQGSSIPFMVIREVVENLIHAYFIQPTISILNHGNTIRFSDQGPGIRHKELAMQYGTTSATEEMRRYIRGVGSGLPYVQQYMADKGGSLHIEDNMAGGTVVTISTMPADAQATQQQSSTYPYPAWQQPQHPQQQPQYQQAPYQQQGGWQQPQYQQTYQYAQPQQWPAWQQQPYGWQQPQQQYPQQGGWQQGGWQQPQTTPQQWPAQPQQGPAQQTPQQQPTPPSADPLSLVTPTERGSLALDYLRTHDSVGPSDLARAHGGSQPTWTRELQALEDQGLILKDGQKRRLTAIGRAWLERG